MTFTASPRFQSTSSQSTFNLSNLAPQIQVRPQKENVQFEIYRLARSWHLSYGLDWHWPIIQCLVIAREQALHEIRVNGRLIETFVQTPFISNNGNTVSSSFLQPGWCLGHGNEILVTEMIVVPFFAR